MSGLREDVIDAMVEHFTDQRGHPPEQMQIEDLTDYADAVLRVLTEHGDTEQPYDITEAVGAAGRILKEDEVSNGRIVRAVMAVVQVVRRDFNAEIQRLRAYIDTQPYHSDMDDLQRDLAAARGQLEQVREGIAQAIIQDASSRPQAAEPFRRGMFTAADIAREYAKEPQEEGR